MHKELLFEIDSPNRDSYKVYGYRFGRKGAKPSVAIVGGMTGESFNQLNTLSMMINFLKTKELEVKGFIPGEILIIPSLNNFALNSGGGLWPLDGTDIDAMFPGYKDGETTQRIAYKSFEILKDFDYGFQLELRKDRATCHPYIKVLQTGYEDIETAKLFGLMFIHLRKPSPLETVSLVYNWQLWGVKAYSLVFGKNSSLEIKSCNEILDGMVRFLSKIYAINYNFIEGFNSNIVTREDIDVIKADAAGIFLPIAECGKYYRKNETLGFIKDSLEGDTLEILKSNYDGIITCIYDYPLIFQNAVAFRMVKIETKVTF